MPSYCMMSCDMPPLGLQRQQGWSRGRGGTHAGGARCGRAQQTLNSIFYLHARASMKCKAHCLLSRAAPGASGSSLYLQALGSDRPAETAQSPPHLVVGLVLAPCGCGCRPPFVVAEVLLGGAFPGCPRAPTTACWICRFLSAVAHRAQRVWGGGGLRLSTSRPGCRNKPRAAGRSCNPVSPQARFPLLPHNPPRLRLLRIYSRTHRVPCCLAWEASRCGIYWICE
jgi:hypothetical protein